MSDKLRTTYPISISFTQGEEPTHIKLNAISTQSKSGLAIVEKAIGDIWNQGGDPITSDYPLHIVNLARALGDQTHLNSVLHKLDFTGTSGSIRLKQTITSFRGQTEIGLDFAPTAASDTVLAASMTTLGYTTRVATKDLIDSTVKWAVNTTLGKIYLGTPLDPDGVSAIVLEYSTTTASDSLDESGFSFIPDPTQSDWRGLKIISVSSGKYLLVLPFRRPLASSTATKLPDEANNSAAIGSPSLLRYWGPVTSGYSYTSGVSDLRLYRYALPEIVLDMFDTPVAGEQIPNGLLYLWDNDNETIVEGVTFKVPEVAASFVGAQVPWIIQAEGATLDSLFSGLTSSGASETSSHYQSRFAIICVGQSVVQAVHALRSELANGSRTVGFSNRISHADLVGVQPAQGTRHPFTFPPGYLDGDDHPQYLSRRGSTSTGSAQRDLYNNGMKGDLLMLSTASGTNFQNYTSDSNRIYFNKVDSTSDGIYLVGTLGYPIPGNSAPTSLWMHAPHGFLPQYLTLGDSQVGSPTQSVFGFAGDSSSVPDSALYAGVFRTTNEAVSLDTWDGSEPATYTQYGADRITWVGATNSLDLSSFSGTGEVTIGAFNSSTDLCLVNNRLLFGPTTTDDSLKFVDSSNAFAFRADGSINSASGMQHSRIIVGGLVLADADNKGITFNNVSSNLDDGLALLANDTLTYDDTKNEFAFKADGASNSATIRSLNTPKIWGIVNVVNSAITSSDGFGYTPSIDGSGVLVITFDADHQLTGNYIVICSNAETGSAPPHISWSPATTRTSSQFMIFTCSTASQTFFNLTGGTADTVIEFVVYGKE